jgi:hypothetical protein
MTGWSRAVYSTRGPVRVKEAEALTRPRPMRTNPYLPISFGKTRFLTLLGSAAYTGFMSHLFLSLVLLSLAVSAWAQPPSLKKPSESRTRDIYVSVLDSEGKAVPGLGAADFIVKEDGTTREVLKAGPATEPLNIAVLVDDSQAATFAIQFLRDGLNGFVKKLEGKAQIALSTIGERPTPIVEYTDSTVMLQKGVTKIFARTGSGAYVMEGIAEVARGLERREAKRPTIVAIYIDAGVEFSNMYYQNVLDGLRKSGATLHVLAIGNSGSAESDEQRNRNIVVAEGTSQTGGRRDQVLAESAIAEKLSQLADELTNQYVVTYARPEKLIPPQKVDVQVGRPGLTVRSTKRAPAR